MREAMKKQIEKNNRWKDKLMLTVTITLVVLLHILMFAGVYLISTLSLYSIFLWSIPVGLGLVTGLLFVIGHDAAHHALFENKRMNNFLAQICFLPAAQSRVLWQRAHNQLHHGFTNFRDKDIVYPPLSPEEYRILPAVLKYYYRVKRTLPGLFLIYLVDVWFAYTFTSNWAQQNRHGHVSNLLAIGTYFLIIGIFVIVLANDFLGLRIFLAIVIPFIVWNYLMAFLTYLHHTHPDVPWFDDYEEWRKHSKESLTVHFLFPEWLDVAFLRIMQHPAHHKNASTQWFNLKEANKSIVAQGNIVQLKCTWQDISRIFQVCKLYDYKNKNWLPYPDI